MSTRLISRTDPTAIGHPGNLSTGCTRAWIIVLRAFKANWNRYASQKTIVMSNLIHLFCFISFLLNIFTEIAWEWNCLSWKHLRNLLLLYAQLRYYGREENAWCIGTLYKRCILLELQSLHCVWAYQLSCLTSGCCADRMKTLRDTSMQTD